MAKDANIGTDANIGDVCVIGAGRMGTALGLSLLGAGFAVAAWNRTAEKCQALAAAGARVAPTPAERWRAPRTP